MHAFYCKKFICLCVIIDDNLIHDRIFNDFCVVWIKNAFNAANLNETRLNIMFEGHITRKNVKKHRKKRGQTQNNRYRHPLIESSFIDMGCSLLIHLGFLCRLFFSDIAQQTKTQSSHMNNCSFFCLLYRILLMSLRTQCYGDFRIYVKLCATS